MIPIMKAILLFSIVLKALNLGMVSSLFIHRAHGTPYGAEFENGIREAEGPYADIHMGQGSNAESLSQVANNQSPVTKDGREAGPKSCMKKKTKDKMDGTQDFMK
ncbi:hypothetical protein DFH28DRAFT_585446 [Melampsora americana]|nr:hypothetical protein DFH28DRAFT_585446 [Melampsora americana]